MTNTNREEMIELLEWVREDIEKLERNIAKDELLNIGVNADFIADRFDAISKAAIRTARAESNTTWQDIAYRFGTSRQAVEQRFGH